MLWVVSVPTIVRELKNIFSYASTAEAQSMLAGFALPAKYPAMRTTDSLRRRERVERGQSGKEIRG